jgi:hypothetical protein
VAIELLKSRSEKNRTDPNPVEKPNYPKSEKPYRSEILKKTVVDPEN